jgi:hypothetical protein
VVHV